MGFTNNRVGMLGAIASLLAMGAHGAPNGFRGGAGLPSPSDFLPRRTRGDQSFRYIGGRANTSRYPKPEDRSKTILKPGVVTRQQLRAMHKPWKKMACRPGSRKRINVAVAMELAVARAT